MATNNVTALRVALDQLIAEGIPTRLERYRRLAVQLRTGLRQVGMQPFTPDEEMTPVLTAAYPPEGVPSSKILSFLYDRYHIKISPGLGDLHETIFRIGHMSPIVTAQDIDDIIQALVAFKAQM
jgi:alanine-glyoxylate transaminase/serine-glyoxylate transaminase/serine-pyruvate transaminase